MLIYNDNIPWVMLYKIDWNIFLLNCPTSFLIHRGPGMHFCVSKLGRHTLKRKCCHFDEILITDCTESCHFDNFRCSQWLKFRQNDDISVSVLSRLGPNHYLNQRWLIVNWTLRDKIRWKFNRNSNFSLKRMLFNLRDAVIFQAKNTTI